MDMLQSIFYHFCSTPNFASGLTCNTTINNSENITFFNFFQTVILNLLRKIAEQRSDELGLP